MNNPAHKSSMRWGPAYNFSILSCLLLFFLCVACTSATQGSTENVGGLVVRQPLRAHWTYVAIGASDTYGIGAPSPTTQNWAAQLAQKIGPDIHLVNLGIPGVDAPEAVNLELPVALDATPNLITVWLAVNDLIDKVPLDRYQSNLTLLLGSLRRAYPSAQILVANIPDLIFVPRFAHENQRILQTMISGYNTLIANSVKQNHATLVDLYTRWQTLANHPEYISNDGYHPSASGYQQLATIFYQTLRQ